jgi:hypothetical protein
MNPLKRSFAEYTLETIIPAMDGWSLDGKVRAMVLTAVTKMETGIGAGPTLEDVITHYIQENEYAKLRVIPDELLQHFLDKAMQYTDVGAWNDTTAWKLPSLRYHMDEYNYGQFKFMTSQYFIETIAPQAKHARAILKAALPFITE